MGRHEQRLSDDECRATFGAVLVILNLTVAYLGLISHVRCHGGMRNAVTQPLASQDKRFRK